MGVVLFFGMAGVVCADEEMLRQALDQISKSYAEAKYQLRDRETAVRALTASIAVARTESDLFQHLWSEAEMRTQTLGANLRETDGVATHRQLVEALRKLYLAESDRVRMVELLKRLVAGIEANQESAGDLAAAKDFVGVQSARMTSGTEGASLGAAHVLEVNGHLQIVVLDVGANQGVRVGMPLIILHGNRLVAKLRVVEVRPKVSGALIEKVENNVTIKAGDTAQVTKG